MATAHALAPLALRALNKILGGPPACTIRPIIMPREDYERAVYGL